MTADLDRPNWDLHAIARLKAAGLISEAEYARAFRRIDARASHRARCADCGARASILSDDDTLRCAACELARMEARDGARPADDS